MSTYKLELIISKDIEVEAESREEAEKKLYHMFLSEEWKLMEDYDDLYISVINVKP